MFTKESNEVERELEVILAHDSPQILRMGSITVHSPHTNYHIRYYADFVIERFYRQAFRCQDARAAEGTVVSIIG